MVSPSNASPAPPLDVPTLSRTLGVRELAALVTGTVIGSGIFIVPAVVLRQSQGSMGLALVVWMLAGLLAVLGALTYAELAVRRPEAGGLYPYLRDSYGPVPAFLCGWTDFFIMTAGSQATLAVAFTSYLKEFLPLDAMGMKLAALAMLAIITLLNVRGTQLGAAVQAWTTAIKVVAILGMSLLCLWKGPHLTTAALHLPPLNGSLLRSIGVALLGVLWAYDGWIYVTFVAGEARHPQRTIPVAISLGTGVLVALYLLANLGYAAALPVDAIMSSDRVAATAMEATLGPGASGVLTALILLAIFSAANGLTLAGPRLYFAMARDGLCPRPLATVHPRFGTPATAIICTSVWAACLTVTGSFEQLLTYVLFAAWIFYGLGAASLFVFRRRESQPTTGFRVPGYPVTPALFILVAIGIVGNSLLSAPLESVIGLAVVATGLPAYWIWRRVGRSASA